jgi:CHAT domain-containing protein
MVECYLALNRYLEARDLAQQVAAEFEALGSSYEQACTVQHLATAEAELGNLEAAQAALDRAEVIFIELGATSWLGVIHLCRGRIALRHGQIELARHEALAAADYYGDQDANRAWAVLLEAQAKLAAGDLDEAAQAGRDVLRIAQRNQIPAQRYSAYVLLGRVMEARQERQRAARAYHLAATIIEQIQRDLTLTLRPGFLEDKSEALHALIRLYLQDGRTECAFETLERAKSQVLLDYLGNRESLHWSEDDPQTRQLIDELNQLRTEHHWYYRLAHENQSSAITPEQAFREASEREQHMRAITEQLYLQKDAARRRVLPPSIHEMQSRLDESALLVEFYNDGTHVWAFILSTTAIDVIQLPVAVDALDQLIDQLQFNITCAVRVGISPAARQLAVLSRQIAQRLYQVLLHPLESIICRYQRLVVVPYGALHYLPFHLLHTGTHYLVEQCEVVVLPAAGLITHRPPQQPKGATVLAHSQDGLLPQALVEARYVHSLFSGDLYTEADGVREVLRRTPRQILHLAAHGEHRIDHPDLSYIQLADGLLYTDDLLQHDLSYELVTLSACESGRAHVDAGDELIGLGRGFLYAGAGALIVSLWRVDDASTVALMRDIYHALSNGSSKAEALRAAQCAALTRDPDLHPAFWGAFQLVGDAGPLSQG